MKFEYVLVAVASMIATASGYTVYDRIRQRLPSNYGRQWADNEPNPQGWAFHNARRFHPSDAFEDSPTAKLPHLLALNPQAKRVFYNLNYHANPQFELAEQSPRKTQGIATFTDQSNERPKQRESLREVPHSSTYFRRRQPPPSRTVADVSVEIGNSLEAPARVIPKPAISTFVDSSIEERNTVSSSAASSESNVVRQRPHGPILVQPLRSKPRTSSQDASSSSDEILVSALKRVFIEFQRNRLEKEFERSSLQSRFVDREIRRMPARPTRRKTMLPARYSNDDVTSVFLHS